MAYRIFLDANVVLEYALLRKNAASVKTLLSDIEASKYKGFISSSVFQICSYWMLKAYGYAKTRELLLDMLSFIKIVDCKHEIIVNALNSSIKDIEDALQYYTALSNQMDYFITFDKDLKKSAIPSLPIFSPHEFSNI